MVTLGTGVVGLGGVEAGWSEGAVLSGAGTLVSGTLDDETDASGGALGGSAEGALAAVVEV